MTARPNLQIGVTLIELILSMLIISILVAGFFSVIMVTVRHSGDPVISYQAIAIAESYMNEILMHPYTDPDGSNDSEAPAFFDDVGDYDGLLETGIHSRQNLKVVDFSRFNVSVAVSPPEVLNGGVAAKKITVSVSAQGFSGLILVAYKFGS